MSHSADPLRVAFLEDHRHLTRGLVALLHALDEGDDVEARRQAELLDRNVGPHMAFEEQAFYPTLRELLPERVPDLYEEHDAGQEVVRRLLVDPREGPLDASERHALAGEVRTMLAHAEACGTLLSHLDGLSQERRRALLETLLELRRQGIRWTELPEPPITTGEE
jgi:hypothetical protein